jgi:hypothetical protein
MSDHAAYFNDQTPDILKSVIHDAVVGEELTIWFDIRGKPEPIGVTMRPGVASRLIVILTELLDNVQ